ncbi:hypothetical protein D3C74_315210 [compost metagenome]
MGRLHFGLLRPILKFVGQSFDFGKVAIDHPADRKQVIDFQESLNKTSVLANDRSLNGRGQRITKRLQHVEAFTHGSYRMVYELAVTGNLIHLAVVDLR